MTSAVPDIETVLRLCGVGLFTLLLITARRSRDLRAGGAHLGRMAGLAAAFVGVVAGLNYVVNPFGIYSSRLFEPVVLHSRTDKARLFRALEPPPEVVILGTSSGFTMPPAYVRELTGQPAFNACLNGGSPRDYLPFLRYMAAVRRVPAVLLVSLSVEQFRPKAPTEFEPHDPLRDYLDGAPRPLLGDARSLLTAKQLEASFRLLHAEARGRGEPFYRFDADGFGRLQASTIPLDRLVDSYLAKFWRPSVFDFDDLDARQVAWLGEFLSLGQELGVRTIAYLPPYHPRAVAIWERESRFPALKARLLDHLRGWQQQGVVSAVYDFTNVDSFGGRADMFHDLPHPTEDAGRRMLGLMLKPLAPSGARE